MPRKGQLDVARPTYETNGMITIVNDRCESLPSCPACGYITNLDEIVVKRTAAAGGGRWVGYILRCAKSVDPHGLRRLEDPDTRPCAFAVPLTLNSTL